MLLNGEGEKIQEKTSKDHTRGGLKTYRRECYDQIEGINETDGWDGIDNITAQMHGWETRSIPELEVLHQRRTGIFVWPTLRLLRVR